MSLDFAEGQILLLNKPYMWTSYNVVSKVKSALRHNPLYRKTKVGHAGTLDPLATGLMIVCTGKKTKEMLSFIGLDKEYVATLKFGATTPSFDLETAVDQVYPYEHITETLLNTTLSQFRGTIKQRPPDFSAKWVNGQRAYIAARAGRDIDIPEIEVEIKKIEILEYNLPTVKLIISCSKGTYIRAMARDLGKALNSGAYLTGLERTRIGNYHLSNALDVNDLINLV